ncbi:MAG: cell division protein ZapA [Alphaproteobacteria bacterium]|jgi:cell division protein ZapA|nr:cell division protein ZapA [Alphaproteobacteria bacterium]MDP6515938.1 cell division protein ZapA [Alphaproteobacteria bacterium]|tara:strand:+ start:84 stop:413 length:330 start_codon:yes stop_codon:yes gene_type:complete
MAQVTVTINGRRYPVACEDGQEDHIQRLAQYLDGRVRDLIDRVGQIGDAHLLLLTGLMVADELSETYDRVEANAKDTKQATGAAQERIAESLVAMAERVENIALKLENA